MTTNDDISKAIVTKSDQLNAVDLIGGPITVTVTGISVSSDPQQPIALSITGHQPYKPCKTMSRLLMAMWGTDGRAWKGRRLTLFRDPDVTYGKESVGGIRIAAASHIVGEFEMTLPVGRARFARFIVQPLETEKSEYPAERFDGMLPKWKQAIEAGSKTAAEIIDMVESTYLMTPTQKDILQTIEVQDAGAETAGERTDSTDAT
jgi:hypothetical protein